MFTSVFHCFFSARNSSYYLAKDFWSCTVAFVIVPLMIVWSNPTMKKYMTSLACNASSGLHDAMKRSKEMLASSFRGNAVAPMQTVE